MSETPTWRTWVYDVTLPPNSEFRTWLLHQIENDWNCATAAGHGDERVSYIDRAPNGGWVELDLTGNVRPSYDVRFAHRHGPRRVRAEADVRRELVDLHADRAGYCDTCGGQWPCLTLRLIAAPYADEKRTTYRRAAR